MKKKLENPSGVTTVWNKLPSHTNFSSVSTFKCNIYNNDFSAFLKRYQPYRVCSIYYFILFYTVVYCLILNVQHTCRPMLSVVNHYACMVLTTCSIIAAFLLLRRQILSFLLGLVFWATILIYKRITCLVSPALSCTGIQFLSKLNMI